MAGEIERAPVNPVVCGDDRLIGVRSHHVEGHFGLWYKFVSKVDGERRVRAGEYCDEMPFESLDGAFGFVGPFVVRGDALVRDACRAKM